MAQSVLSFISSPPSLFSFLPLHFHLTLVLSSFSLFPLLSFCVCRFSVPPSSPLLYPSLSYRGLRRELAASVFVGNFVLAGLWLSMAHLFAPVKKKKKITKKLFQPMSSVVSLGILVWIFAVRLFFFFPMKYQRNNCLIVNKQNLALITPYPRAFGAKVGPCQVHALTWYAKPLFKASPWRTLTEGVFVGRWHGESTSYSTGCQKRLAGVYTSVTTEKSVFFWEEHFQIVLIVTGNEQSLELASCGGPHWSFKASLGTETFWFCGWACSL